MYKSILKRNFHWLVLVMPLVLLVAFIKKDKAVFFGAKGKEIIAPNGKPVLLKGINLGNWLVPEGYMFKFKNASSPRIIDQAFQELIGPEKTAAFWDQYLETYITKDDIFYIKKLGFNHVRVPFNYRMLTDEYYMGRNDRGFKYLDKVIGWCKEADLYVLLDMHCAPGGQTGDNIDDGSGYPYLFESAQSQELVTKIWRDIAAHYKNETIIIGYDLLNEPIAHYFDNKEELNSKLLPLYKKIVKAIREKDTNHLIFLGGAQWNTNFKIFDAPFDDKLVYTFHKYWFTVEQGAVQEYVDFSNKYNVPVYLGESGENTDEWVKDFRVLLETNNIGWGFWPYKKMDNTKGVVSFSVPEGYEDIIKYADANRGNFGEIRNERVKTKNVESILQKFNVNSEFSNCYPNNGYIQSLGLKPVSIK